MVTLAETVASRRIYYPRPVASLPDILMIGMPRRFASWRPASRRFHPIMIETTQEQAEVEAFLAEDRDSLVMPDILGDRLSSLAGDQLTIAHYRPSRAAWPFVQLCQWPAAFTARARGMDRAFARGAYTFELFRDRVALEKATRTLLASLEGRHSFQVATIFPDWSADPGARPG